MPSLKEQKLAAQRRQEQAQGLGSDAPMAQPYVVPRHVQFLLKTEEEQRPSEHAIAVGNSIQRGEFKRPRTGRFSPSSIGECNRRLVLGYEGAMQDSPDLDSLDLMSMGTRDHFWWQMEGLTEGWMTDAEFWVHDPVLQVGGSIDGILADGSILELKTVMGSKLRRIIMDGPVRGHLLQIACYLLLSDRQWASLVYQARDTGKFFEFRVQRSEELEDEVVQLLATMKEFTDAGTLPVILPDCEIRVGDTFKRCPFRSTCIDAHKDGR